MSLNDPLSNVLSHLLQADRKGVRELIIKHNSKVIRKVLDILCENGYLGSYEIIPNNRGGFLKLNLLGRINNVGVIKPQHHIGKSSFERFEKRYLPAKDFGLMIISTNEGIITHIEAKKKSIGGKLLCYCY